MKRWSPRRGALLCAQVVVLSSGCSAGIDPPSSDPSTQVDAPTSPSPSDAASSDAPVDGRPRAAPPATWKEHWFEHDQMLKLARYDDDVAIYYDDDVTVAGTEWILPFMGDLWRYTRKTYGDFGDGRLYLIFHEGRYSGGHPSTYFDDSHDNRNVSDCGPGAWTDEGTVDMPSHEVGHIVEGASRGVHGSPAFGLWGDSKWAEFYQYDVYVALGKTSDARRLYDRFMAGTDDFPRADTHWFRDWFFPLWRDHGHGQVMARFFQLLSKHYPKQGNDYARDMNWGEYVHFMSGAAATNLKAQATQAFGWPAERETEFQAARREFAAITY